MSALVICEHDNVAVRSVTLNTVNAALELSENVDLLVAGNSCASVAEECASISGVKRIFLAEDVSYEHDLPENLAPLVVHQAEGYSYIMAAASTFGKSLLPRVAALLDVQQISDISQVQSADIFVRPIYAGNAMATVKSTDRIKIITVRTTAFDAVSNQGGCGVVDTIDPILRDRVSEFLGQDITPSERPELTSAGVVISGGRGMQSGENFSMLERIADKLGAAVGASRAAVDAGYVPNDYQVGQTGKVVAPDLYIAVGISGAIQHLAGMKDSKVIVAINKDEEAPIFQIADYGWVADLFSALPEFEAALDNDS
jgi:electron transfer flavoprotein alpha subunit